MIILTIILIIYLIIRIYKTATAPNPNSPINLSTLDELEQNPEFKEFTENFLCGLDFIQEIDDFPDEDSSKLKQNGYIERMINQKTIPEDNTILNNYFRAVLDSENKKTVYCYYYTTFKNAEEYGIYYRIGLGRMFNVFDKHIDRDKKKILLNKNDYKITYKSLQRIFIKNDEDIAKVLPKGVIIPIWDWSFYIRGIDCSDLGKNITNEQFWEYAQTTFLNEVLLTVEEIWKETCKAENKVFDEEKQQLINFAKKTLIRKAVYMGLGAV